MMAMIPCQTLGGKTRQAGHVPFVVRKFIILFVPGDSTAKSGSFPAGGGPGAASVGRYPPAE